MTSAGSRVRNFSIVAHIDHGKSTLADRFLLLTQAISPREFHEQFLDDMELERERGITIKARAVRILYRDHPLNLIDTPGHIDFTYEVRKSLAACEGVILLVDATQGVQAQTMTNFYLTLERDLTIIPVVSKIDLPNAEPDRVRSELVELTGCRSEEVILTSAKTGQGIEAVLDAVLERVPPPKGDPGAPLKALIFDSRYDTYQGVIAYLRVFDGKLQAGDKIRLMQEEKEYEVEEVGIFNPHPHKVPSLTVGEVGYLAANIREVKRVKIGDTVTLSTRPTSEALPGYQEMKPMVFAGFYPINQKDFTALREAIEKLRLNDSSFQYEPETSASLGFGYRCGFLGLLHMDVIRERLEREFQLELLITAPNVVYRVTKTNREVLELDNPTQLPPPQEIDKLEEPFIAANLIIPAKSLGAVMQLCQDRRGVYKSTEYLDSNRAVLAYELPFAEVLVDFHDKIKSLTSGYGSLNYDFIGYRSASLVKLDVLINGEPVDALSTIVVRDQAYYRGKTLVEKLKDVIPRQLFEVVVQAAIGSKIIARDSIRPLKKNVTGKCYGGDITRKRKLWEKQKEGKKRMKRIGKVDLPQEAFISVLKLGE
ncbi:MAG: elongation factor 4 [Candidatus Omnitrophica bacterium]|nr:elongation factor 4 [Candidatus Omnitrophota bacterium]